ncbi:MAG: rod shape-determining protein MreC [Saprospiraceae bacterium]|nr:rod shape-determining protein MreC [Saprospiraceae bacterium]
MQNILLLFARFGSHITFIFLTIFSFVLIVNYNQTQRSIFINSSNYYANKLDSKTSRWQSYLSLQEVNDSLAKHNATLMEKFINIDAPAPAPSDTSIQYDVIPAKVIRSTFNLRNNHLTLNVGTKEGVQKDMGVISENGLIGIVREVNENFAHVISVLNSQSRISCSVKDYAYPGNLIWKDLDPNFMHLQSIPKHVGISIGDTVITNGYSTIFPRDIMVGTIAAFKVEKGSSNYNIKVKLSNNIPNTQIVYVINNKLAEEQKALEIIGDE